MRLLVLAKAPVAGLVKTRLQAALAPEQAAAVAEAALADTLTAVVQVAGVRPVLVLDGVPGPWLPDGLAVEPQVEGTLAVRIEAALVAEAGPALLIGMDTPQVTPVLLAAAVDAVTDHDAALGLAADGGWWALGLRTPRAHAGLVLGVPTSRGDTGARQRRALVEAGLTVADLPVLHDVDTPDDLVTVARLAPEGRFGVLVGELLAVRP